MRVLHEYEAHDSRNIVLLAAHCPACGYEHSFRIDEAYWSKENSSIWEFNGDYEKPTFTPSILVNKAGHPGRPICHSYVTDGQWVYLEDSTHEYAGLTVPMVPYPDPDPDPDPER